MKKNALFLFLLVFLLNAVDGVSGQVPVKSDILYVNKTVSENKSSYSIFNGEGKNYFVLTESGEFIDCKKDNFTMLQRGGALVRFDLKSGRSKQIGRINYNTFDEIGGKFYFDELNNVIYAVTHDESQLNAGVRSVLFSLNRYDFSGGVSTVYQGVGEVFGVNRTSEGVIRLYQKSGYIDVNFNEIGKAKKYRVGEVNLKNLMSIKSDVAFFYTDLGGLEIRRLEGWGLLAKIDGGHGFYIPHDYDSVSKKALVVNVVNDGDVLFEVDVNNHLLMRKIKVKGLVGSACYARKIQG